MTANTPSNLSETILKKNELKNIATFELRPQIFLNQRKTRYIPGTQHISNSGVLEKTLDILNPEKAEWRSEKMIKTLQSTLWGN